MSKYPILKPNEVTQALNKIGFREARRKGSHIQMKKGNVLVTVPYHNMDIKLEILK